MGRLSRTESIIWKMDDLALAMLERVKGISDAIGTDLQMDVFEKVAKWIAVKNKLESDDGDGIAGYKDRIYGKAPKPKGNTPKPTNGGERLAEIKSRLPHSDAGEPDGNSNPALS